MFSANYFYSTGAFFREWQRK